MGKTKGAGDKSKRSGGRWSASTREKLNAQKLKAQGLQPISFGSDGQSSGAAGPAATDPINAATSSDPASAAETAAQVAAQVAAQDALPKKVQIV